MKNVILCADDYSQNPAINRAILDLASHNRLGAISCLTQSPTWAEDARTLLSSATGQQLGLHFNLTLPYGMRGQQVGRLMLAAMLRRIDPEWVRGCFVLQWDEFVRKVGRNPDFVDGHQHVHAFPVIRDVLAEQVADRDPGCWIRSLEPPPDLPVGNGKQAILRRYSRSLVEAINADGLRTNPFFCGFRPYRPSFDFRRAFRQWLCSSPEGGVIMCHPGDAGDDRSDPIRHCRTEEYAYLSSEGFAVDLENYGVLPGVRAHPD